jgi:hypothetical protein
MLAQEWRSCASRTCSSQQACCPQPAQVFSQQLPNHAMIFIFDTLMIKYRPLENAPMVVKIAQNWSKLRKTHSFEVERTVKIALKKWIVDMAAHDGLFSPLKSNINLSINERYLPSYQTRWKLG